MTELNEYLQRIAGICHYPITFEGDGPVMLNRWIVTGELAKGRGTEGIEPHLSTDAEILLDHELAFSPQEKLEHNWRYFISNHQDTFYQAVYPEPLFTNDEPKYLYLLCVVYSKVEQHVLISVVHPVPLRAWINGRLVITGGAEYNVSPYLFSFKLKQGYNIVLVERIRNIDYHFTMFLTPRRYLLNWAYQSFFDKKFFKLLDNTYYIIPGKAIFSPEEKPTMVILPRKFDDEAKEPVNVNVFNTQGSLMVSFHAFTSEMITLEFDDSVTGVLKVEVEHAKNKLKRAETYFFKGDFEQAKQQLFEKAGQRNDCSELLIHTFQELTRIPEICEKLCDHSEIHLHNPMFKKYSEFENYLQTPDGPVPKTLFQVFRDDVMLFKNESIDDGFLAYSIFLPPRYRPEKSYPLLLSLQYGHACSTYPRVINYIGNRQFQEVIILNISGRGGLNRDYINDLNFIDIIQEVVKNYHIDRERIYIVGSCTGALKAFSLALRKPDLFAGVVSFNGTPRLDLKNPDYEYLKNISNTTIYSINLVEDNMFNHIRVIRTLKYLRKVKAWSFQGIPHDEFDELFNNQKVAKKVIQERRVKYPKSLFFTIHEPVYNKSYWLKAELISDLNSQAVIAAEIISKNKIKVDLENIDRCSLLLDKRAMGLNDRIELWINGFSHWVQISEYAEISINAQNPLMSIQTAVLSAQSFAEAYHSIGNDPGLLGIKEVYFTKCVIIKADYFQEKATAFIKDLFHLLQRPLKERIRNYKYNLVLENEITDANLAESNFVTVIDSRNISPFQQKVLDCMVNCKTDSSGINYHGKEFQGEYFALIKYINPSNHERYGLSIIYNTENLGEEIMSFVNSYDTNPLFYSDAVIYHEGRYHSFRNYQ